MSNTIIKCKKFHGSWYGGNKLNALALRQIADWVESDDSLRVENIISHSDEDMYLFIVYYTGGK